MAAHLSGTSHLGTGMVQLHQTWKRYGVPPLCIVAASGLYLLTGTPDIDFDLKYFGLIFVVLFSAIWGGLGPGLFATGLATLSSAYLLFPPDLSVYMTPEVRLIRLVFFAGECALLSLVGHMIRKADVSEAPVSGVQRYVPAMLFVSAATGFRLLAWRNIEDAVPFSMYYVAVSASAWIGGPGPGLAACLISGLCARYFFLEPRYSLLVTSPADAAKWSGFVIEAILLIYFSSQRASARRIAVEAITELRTQGQRLWKTLEYSRALRAISRDVIWEWDLGPDLPQVRQVAFADHRGPRSLDSVEWMEQIHPKDRLKVLQSLRWAVDSGRREWAYQYRRLRQGGGYVRVADHAYVIRDSDWKPLRIVGRSAEVAETPEFGVEGYRAVFENSPRATLLVDRGMRIVEANDAAADLLGYSPAELASLPVGSIFVEARRTAAIKKLLDMESEEHSSVTFEEDCKRADGGLMRARIDASLVPVKDTPINHMLTIQDLGDTDMAA